MHAIRTLTRLGLTFALVFGVVAASSVPAAHASSSREKLHKRIFDVPHYPSHPKRKVKIIALALQKIEMDPFTPGTGWAYDDAIKGQKGIHVYRLLYRTNYFPWKRHQEGDVYATVSMGGGVFHDGYGWNGFLGPFTRGIGDYKKMFPCFSKLLFLPDIPMYQPGQKLSMWLNFSRTKQRIHQTTTILAGGDRIGGAVPIAEKMGCKYLDGVLGSIVEDPSFISPAGP